MTTSHKILSIDDSRSVHAFLDRCLTGTTYHLVHALSAKEGIAILKAELNQINLIFLDWEMPEQNGPEAFEEIRRITQTIPVIMITSKNKPEEIQEMLNLGITEYIMKPFTPDILIAKIETVLGEQ